ncbi:hypothetical protein BKA61DRAFT_581628 [Leptodontidium sp. MPI-SDFR-AT-0119]|nr:hypothetical protein BKA61DRAFT_581628 [Leptodontidium sp. MPI-SDFR-AT-0119]
MLRPRAERLESEPKVLKAMIKNPLGVQVSPNAVLSSHSSQLCLVSVTRISAQPVRTKLYTAIVQPPVDDDKPNETTSAAATTSDSSESMASILLVTEHRRPLLKSKGEVRAEEMPDEGLDTAGDRASAVNTGQGDCIVIEINLADILMAEWLVTVVRIALLVIELVVMALMLMINMLSLIVR